MGHKKFIAGIETVHSDNTVLNEFLQNSSGRIERTLDIALCYKTRYWASSL
jgi:hypothetical protein